MTDHLYRPGQLGARFPFAADLVLGRGARAPEPDDGDPWESSRRLAPETGRTWLEAATAIPEPGWWRGRQDRPAYARVYRTGPDLEDPELGPCWHWRCEDCRTQSNGCAHTVLHEVGTWRAAMCGGLHHIHTGPPPPPPPRRRRAHPPVRPAPLRLDPPHRQRPRQRRPSPVRPHRDAPRPEGPRDRPRGPGPRRTAHPMTPATVCRAGLALTATGAAAAAGRTPWSGALLAAGVLLLAAGGWLTSRKGRR
jgi:hypothetical protein